jgi:hypothetical protein
MPCARRPSATACKAIKDSWLADTDVQYIGRFCVAMSRKMCWHLCRHLSHPAWTEPALITPRRDMTGTRHTSQGHSQHLQDRGQRVQRRRQLRGPGAGCEALAPAQQSPQLHLQRRCRGFDKGISSGNVKLWSPAECDIRAATGLRRSQGLPPVAACLRWRGQVAQHDRGWLGTML